MVEEIIKDIIGYEGHYKVSNMGYIISVKKGKYLKLKAGINNGYHIVVLVKDKMMDCKYVHRIVASHFIVNPDNLPFVNHIDGNKGNQSVINLEWCTPSYNSNYIPKNGVKLGNKKKILNTKTGEIYSSLKDAYVNLNPNRSITIFSRMVNSGTYGYLKFYIEEPVKTIFCLPCRIYKSKLLRA